MSFLDKIFGTTPQQQQVPVQQPGTQQIPGQIAPGAPGNIPSPTVVADPNNPTAPVQEPVTPVTPEVVDNSPLAEFSKLWEDDPKKEGDTPPEPPAALKAEDVQKIVAKTDFSQAITPETLAAITAGGEDAAKAFAQAMNLVAQQVMVQSTMVNNKLTEQAVERALTAHKATLPDMLRSGLVADHAKNTNPLFANPAIKPVMEAVQSQLLSKFPDATPAEITDMAQRFVITIGQEFAPKEVVNDNSGVETDWDKFMDAI